jgi:hypothetical protein
MADQLATIYVDPPFADVDVWTVTIRAEDEAADGAWFEYPTAAEAFAHAVKWITDRGLRMDCRFNVYPRAAAAEGAPQ